MIHCCNNKLLFWGQRVLKSLFYSLWLKVRKKDSPKALINKRTHPGSEEEVSGPDCGCKTASGRAVAGPFGQRVRDQSSRSNLGGQCGVDAVGRQSCGDTHMAGPQRRLNSSCSFIQGSSYTARIKPATFYPPLIIEPCSPAACTHFVSFFWGIFQVNLNTKVLQTALNVSHFM